MDSDQVFILILNDDVRQQLRPLAADWEDWIRTHQNAEAVAYQLAAYQSLAQKYIDGNEIEQQD